MSFPIDREAEISLSVKKGPINGDGGIRDDGGEEW